MVFERTIQLIGQEAFERLQRARVILFGCGGVGGWCAEALVRTGVQDITLVDFDVVAESNLNRQLAALETNIGQPKMEALKERLQKIQSPVKVRTKSGRYSAETAADFDLNEYDYVIDAIDSVSDKVLLIQNATQSTATLFSSMGAARKLDATQVRVSEFRKVEGCPLARALRTKMKKEGIWPQKKFQCVWSPEVSSVSGTIAPVVGAFGMTLAGLVVQDICQKTCNN